MRVKLEGEDKFKAAAEESDIVKLLRPIKTFSYQYETQCYPYRAVHMTMQTLYLTSQKEG
eukprot:4806062-Ditylum_brightwellii.AAC.1